MQIAILYISTAVIFLGLDAIGLRLLIRPIFETHVGHLLLDNFRLVAAGVFYLFYVGGLLYFVSLPALRGNGAGMALVNGAILGALAYGTFEFTAYAVLKDWSIRMVVTDVLWGTALTGFSAWAGVMITKALTAA